MQDVQARQSQQIEQRKRENKKVSGGRDSSELAASKAKLAVAKANLQEALLGQVHGGVLGDAAPSAQQPGMGVSERGRIRIVHNYSQVNEGGAKQAGSSSDSSGKDSDEQGEGMDEDSEDSSSGNSHDFSDGSTSSLDEIHDKVGMSSVYCVTICSFGSLDICKPVC